MRHVDERDAEPALQALELDLHFFAQLQIERAERLVEQQHLGLIDERARQRDALTLPARQLRGTALALRTELHEIEHFARALRARRGIHAAHSRTVGHVLEHGHVREQARSPGRRC